MKLFSNRNIVKELEKRRKWNKIERNGTIGFIAVCATVFFGRAVKIIADVFADMFNIMGCGVVVLGIGGRRITNGNNRYLKDLSDSLSAVLNEEFSIKSLDDIMIIPKNICIGENLEASNAFDIFKEGHYVLVKSKEKSLVLCQLETDGEYRVDIMDKKDAYDALFEIVTEDNNGARKKFANDVINSLYDQTPERTRLEDLKRHNELSKAFLDMGIEQAETAELVIKDTFGYEKKIDVSYLLEERKKLEKEQREIEQEMSGFIDIGIDTDELKGIGLDEDASSKITADEAIGLSFDEDMDNEEPSSSSPRLGKIKGRPRR